MTDREQIIFEFIKSDGHKSIRQTIDFCVANYNHLFKSFSSVKTVYSRMVKKGYLKREEDMLYCIKYIQTKLEL